MTLPDFERERALTALTGGPTCGVDEVGRGPLAGPVITAAVILTPAVAASLQDAKLTDSKKLSATARARLADALKSAAAEGTVRFAYGAASVAEIERLNIRQATHVAMRRAVRGLERSGPPPTSALVDGRDAPNGLASRVETVVGGDARCLSIAAASVVAKELRDGIMRALARRWPGFGWESNAGYGSAAHRGALLRLGPTPHHRASFCRKTLESCDI